MIFKSNYCLYVYTMKIESKTLISEDNRMKKIIIYIISSIAINI